MIIQHFYINIQIHLVSLVTIIYRIFIALCNTALATDDNQFVKYITKSPGIHFDPVGTLKLTNDHVHFVIPWDLNFIKPHLINTKNIFSTYKVLCNENRAVDDFQCLNMLHPLTSLYDDVLRDHDAISHLIPLRSKRTAWFSGIGTILKKLFGTMDEDDSEQYHNSIQNLYSNDQKLASLMKKNVYFSKAAILNFNETLTTIVKNEARLNEATNALFKNVSVLSNAILFRNKMTEAINILQANLLALSFKIEDIVNAIMFVNSNTLHPSVATPTQLYADITQNVKNLPKYKEYPISVDLRNINVLLKVSELDVYFSYNTIVFIIRIPLVYNIEYDIYRTVPVPIAHNKSEPNSYAMIIPTKNYVALSKDKSTYCTLDSIKDCKSIYRGTLACDLVDISSVNTNPICEIELMTRIVTTLPPTCKTKFMYGNVDIWQNLGRNNWLFVQSQSTKLSVECNSDIKEITINGTGILSLKPQCIAFCRNVKLLAVQNLEINISHIRSDFNIVEDKCCDINKFSKLNLNTSEIKLSNINLESLKNMKNLVDMESKDLDNLILNNDNILSRHISFPIITIVLTIAFTLLLFYICKANGTFKSCKKRNLSQMEQNTEIEEVPLPRLRIG